MSDNALSFGAGGGQVDFAVNQSSHGFSTTPPTPIYYDDGSSIWKAAQANSADTLGTHLVIEIIDVDNFKATNIGRITVAAHTLTIGEYYFVSKDTAGALVTVEPDGFSNPIVYIEDSDILHVLPFRPSTKGTALDPGWTVFPGFTYINVSSFYVNNDATNLAIFKPGRPLRYRQDPFNWGWGMVASITVGSPTPSDITINLAGASFSSSYDEMLYGEFNKVSVISFAINGAFADSNDNQLLLNDLNYRYRWNGGEACCVMVSHRVTTDDSAGVGNNPFVNLHIEGSGVCSANTYGGKRTLSTAWVDSTTDIDMTNYIINYNDSIEVTTRVSSGNDDASNLSIQGVFIFR